MRAENRIAVQLPGISPEEAADLIGRTALLEFREPVSTTPGKFVCLRDDGTEFTVARGEVTEIATAAGREGAPVRWRRTAPVGVVKWRLPRAS